MEALLFPHRGRYPWFQMKVADILPGDEAAVGAQAEVQPDAQCEAPRDAEVPSTPEPGGIGAALVALSMLFMLHRRARRSDHRRWTA